MGATPPIGSISPKYVQWSQKNRQAKLSRQNSYMNGRRFGIAALACWMGRNMPNDFHNPRVLVADDESVIADTLVMILKQAGFDARAVYSGEDALVQAESF